MLGLFESTKKWFSEGQCENNSDHDIYVCVQKEQDSTKHELEVLKPGERTPKGKDCEGYINKDGDGKSYKVYGKTGSETKIDEIFLEKNWPECAKKIVGTNLNLSNGILSRSQ